MKTYVYFISSRKKRVFIPVSHKKSDYVITGGSLLRLLCVIISVYSLINLITLCRSQTHKKHILC